MGRIVVCCVVVTALAEPASLAEIPKTISFQGRMTSDGAPMSGTVDITVGIYTLLGQALFTETHPGVAVSDGIFNILIGSRTSGGVPSSVFDGPQRFVGITVGDDAEMTPRLPLTATAYAYRAEAAETLDLPLRIEEDSAITLLNVVNTGSGIAVRGHSADGPGVAGGSTEGVGVAGSGATRGVSGTSAGTAEGSAGVYGTAAGTSARLPAQPVGVWGDSDTGYAVAGTSGSGIGVYAASGSGTAIVASASTMSQQAIRATNTDGNAIVGRHGASFAPLNMNAGVIGSSSRGHGIHGATEATSGEIFGGHFQGDSPEGGGVAGTSGPGVGVIGYHTGTQGNPAVYGRNEGVGHGVFGTTEDNDYESYGGYFVGGSVRAGGVKGISDRGTGVTGVHSNADYAKPAVHGTNNGAGDGVRGDAHDGYGGYFSSLSGTALCAAGDAEVTGDLSVGGGAQIAGALTIDGNVTAGGQATVDKVSYNNPRTHYLSVSPAAFNTTGGEGRMVPSGVFVSRTGYAVLTAGVELPHGAVVTRFSARVYDAGAGDLTVSLMKESDSGSIAMASLFSSGTSGYQDKTTTSISNNPIDNSNCCYRVTCVSNNWPASDDLMLMRAVIEYTIDEAP